MSDKSISEKLLIKPDYRVLITNSPKGYLESIGHLPTKSAVFTESKEPVDLIQAFISSKKELESQLINYKSLLKPGGLLWVTYPKGTSKMKADINRDSINGYAQTIGMQAVAMISVDDTWSALRLKLK